MDYALNVCKKCLIYEMAEKDQYKNMYDYINGLDEEIKCDDELYAYRLAQCKECEKLMNGMCRVCGCFVEMRAAVKGKGCPDVKGKW